MCSTRSSSRRELTRISRKDHEPNWQRHPETRIVLNGLHLDCNGCRCVLDCHRLAGMKFPIEATRGVILRGNATEEARSW
jgi:hypothetical protein